MSKLLFLAGSAREGSYSKKVAKAAFKLAGDMGAGATFIDLRDYPMPLYDGDLEAAGGMPENAKKLKVLFAQSDGYFIVTPEYNGFFPPLLKNVIDWMSRSDDEDIGNPYQGKVAGLAGSSPGAMGGIRAIPHLRTLLCGLGVHVIPQQVAIGSVSKAFAKDGTLGDDRQRDQLTAVVEQLIFTADRLKV